MKPIYTAILIVLPFITIAQSQKIVLTSQVGIRGRDCSGGLGLCSMETGKTTTAKTIFINSQIEHKTQNQLSLLFLKNTLTSEDLKSFLLTKEYNTMVFAQQDNYVVPSTVLESLDYTKKELQITKGYYPVVETKDTYEVIFNLQ